MGGLKRKIPIEKRETKQQRSVTFSKRRQGLFKKAAELCTMFDAQIAVIATGPSDNTKNCFYSFGHSSVDEVVDAFLQNRRPNGDAGTKESLTTSSGLLEGSDFLDLDVGKCENVEEVEFAMEKIRRYRDAIAREFHARNTKSDDPNPRINLSDSPPDESLLSQGDFSFDGPYEPPTHYEQDLGFFSGLDGPIINSDSFVDSNSSPEEESLLSQGEFSFDDGPYEPPTPNEQDLGFLSGLDSPIINFDSSGLYESVLGFNFDGGYEPPAPTAYADQQWLTTTTYDASFGGADRGIYSTLEELEAFLNSD